MSEMNQFVSVAEARATILGALTPLGAQRLTLTHASGRRLFESVAAPADSPAFDNSAMDGFAFRFSDAGHELRVVGESAAGVPFVGEVQAGEATRIMTGAMMPAGCDTVAMREICTVDGDTLTIDWTAVDGASQHVRRRGSYMRAGERVLTPAALLRPADIGLLASFGRTVVSVFRQPRVGIITTGSELVEPDCTLGPGQIFNSNAYMLEALVHASGAAALVAPVVPDDEDATRSAFRDLGAKVDLLLTVGGVSVGDYDYVRQILDEETAGMAFWKVRMKPGKPLAFGMLRPHGVPVIGLPGNPVSSFVGYHQFVRPALDVLQGAAPSDCGPRTLRLRTTAAITSTPHRQEYVIGHIDASSGEASFTPHVGPSSGNLVSMHRCDAFGVVDEGVSAVAAGDWVEVEIL